MGIFKTIRKTSVCTAASGLVGIAAIQAGAVTFTEGTIAGSTWSDTVGQNFIVGLEPTPDPGLIVGDPVKLDEFRTFRAGAGFGDPNADIYLAITEGPYFDWNGDPDGSFVPTVADMLAVSENSFNPTTLAAGDPMAFTFGGGVDLLYGGMYGAAYVTIDASNNVTPTIVGSLIGDWALDELLGVWVPTQNHGEEDDFNASALYADFDGEGSLDGCQFACDMSFLVTFSTVEALVGDLDGDGFVGIADLNIVLGNWNQNVTAGDPLVGDPSGDGFVGIEDLNQVLGNWNAGTPPASVVSEPASVVSLLLVGALSLRRRRL